MPKSKAMKKSQIILQLSETNEVSKREADAFIDSLWQLAIDQIKAVGEFTIPGFGKFVLKDRKARMGRNPATGESIKIAAKKTLKFRVAKAMKDEVLPKKEQKKKKK